MKIFITGGTTGIGLSLALEYLKEGHEVAICGRDLKKLPEGLLEKFSNLKTYELDVLDREKFLSCVLDFGKGELDMMIANAGIGMAKKQQIPDFENTRMVMNINIFGTLNAFEAALQQMLPRGKGHLVATASVAGMVGLPGVAAYSASKSAVIKMCESYAIDLKPKGIFVTAICPGFVDTPLTRRNHHPMPFLLTSEQGAQLIKNAIEKKKAFYIFPWPMLVVMSILSRMPRILYRTIMGFKSFNYSVKNK